MVSFELIIVFVISSKEINKNVTNEKIREKRDVETKLNAMIEKEAPNIPENLPALDTDEKVEVTTIMIEYDPSRPEHNDTGFHNMSPPHVFPHGTEMTNCWLSYKYSKWPKFS